jgi:hypothetical protein
MSCIYCPSEGPYTAEHVVSAGLGGDDPQWLLEGCVCSICNTKIFSPLETKVLRSSPLAWARLFLQPHTRNRRSSAGTPSVQPGLSFYYESTSRVLLEQDLTAGGQSVILPQIIPRPPDRLDVVARDVPAAREFKAALESVLVDEVMLIEKRVQPGTEKPTFMLTALTWAEGRYSTGEPKEARQPPKDGVWIEPLEKPATAPAEALLPARVYQRTAGQFVCRSPDVAVAALLLSALRDHLHEVVVPDDVPQQADAAPGVHQRLRYDLAAYDRVLTKIGVNLCAKLLGPEYVRQREFDTAKHYARTGEGAVLKMRPDEAQRFEVFKSPYPNHHILALLPCAGQQPGAFGIVFCTRFYDGQVEAIRIADFSGPVPGLSSSAIILVDYVHHQIARLS